MSKGNLFLGQARGSVGDVTFTHIAGEQVARARNRSPRNPRVPSQMLQRIVLNSASKAYSLMQRIVDHSFEGVQGVARNQQRFMQLNTSAFRDKLAEVIANPTEEAALASTAHSFSFKGDFYPQLNEYLISEGTLPRQVVRCNSASSPRFQLRMPVNLADVISYADVIQALDVQPGDQLTFIGLGHQYGSAETYDQVSAFAFARVILEPAGGDLDVNFLGDDDRPNDPSPKNEGDVALSILDDADGHYIQFSFTSMTNTVSEDIPSMVGAAVILSRFEAGRWRRSAQTIVPAIFGDALPALDTATFGAAYASYLTGDSSNLFLNGSPVGAPLVPAAEPATVTSVTSNGANVSRGSTVNGALGVEILVTGSNLTSRAVQMVNAATEEIVAADEVTSTGVTWNDGVPSDSICQLVINGEVYALFVGNE